MNIETKRLVLRALEPEDAEFLAGVVNDPEVRDLLGAYELVFPVGPKAEAKWIASVSAREGEAHMTVTLRRGGRPIGILSVKDMDDRNASAHLSIVLERPSWDQGFGTEAVAGVLDFLFNRMNVHRVWLRVNERNVRAIRCYEKCGFSRDGILREDHFERGCWASSIIMSVLADEFRGRGR